MCNTSNTNSTRGNSCCLICLLNLLFGNGCGCNGAWNTQRVCRDACGNLRVVGGCPYAYNGCGYNAAASTSQSGCYFRQCGSARAYNTCNVCPYSD